MDKKIRKTLVKKLGCDRGDLKNIRSIIQVETKHNLQMGDSEKLKTLPKKEDELKKFEHKRDFHKLENAKPFLDLEMRRLLREKYTVKLYNRNDKEKEKGGKIENKSTDDETSKEEKETVQRKPVIKTISIKNDNRVYKAVTFEDKKEQSTPLEIKLPIDLKKLEPKLKPSRSSIDKKEAKLEPSKSSIDKPRRRKKRYVASPGVRKELKSPKTEVAKWVPSCLTRTTQPYYEAWVDTKLAAVTKISSKEKLDLFETFERFIPSGHKSPELVYEKCHDERYIGRIRIKQK